MNWEQLNELIAKYRDRPGLKGKIIAKCIECSVDPLDKGTWRQQIEGCTSTSCPLYDVRPVMSPKKGKKESENEDANEIIG